MNTTTERTPALGAAAVAALGLALSADPWGRAFGGFTRDIPSCPRYRPAARPEPVLRHVAIAKAKKKRAAKQARHQRRKS